MKKNYIKMNDGYYLSIGNIINVIKEVSNNNNAMQPEIFSCIFGVNNVNASTINNYCIGIRAIGIEYKNIFKNLYENNELVDNVLSILNILDDKIYIKDDNSLELINKNEKLSKVIDKLFTLAGNDNHIDNLSTFKKETNYETFIELLKYSILDNKQPIFKQDINIKFNKQELDEYMKVKLYWGHSNISALMELASKNNMYACADLGSMEADGLISGVPNYQKSYEYYLKAANKNHPKGCWMVANLMISGRIKIDYDIMWKYLNKSIELGSAAGYNTLGLCYQRGINKEGKKDLEKAKYYFETASELGYSYAFNNLGKMYEKSFPEEAIKYYKISADMHNSWALNKVGEYYRQKGDFKTAFIYYNEAINCPITEICLNAYYNLAKYYYEKGNKDAKIDKNEELYNLYISKCETLN